MTPSTINRRGRSSPRIFSSSTFMVVLTNILLLTVGFQGTLAVRKRFRSAEPQFTAAIGNMTFMLGGKASLMCSVKNMGIHKIGWIRVSDEAVLTLNQGTLIQSNRFRVIYREPSIWELQISRLKKSDSGCYKCQVSTRGLKSQTGCINVIDTRAKIQIGYSASLPSSSLPTILIALFVWFVI